MDANTTHTPQQQHKTKTPKNGPKPEKMPHIIEAKRRLTGGGGLD